MKQISLSPEEELASGILSQYITAEESHSALLESIPSTSRLKSNEQTNSSHRQKGSFSPSSLLQLNNQHQKTALTVFNKNKPFSSIEAHLSRQPIKPDSREVSLFFQGLRKELATFSKKTANPTMQAISKMKDYEMLDSPLFSLFERLCRSDKNDLKENTHEVQEELLRKNLKRVLSEQEIKVFEDKAMVRNLLAINAKILRKDRIAVNKELQHLLLELENKLQDDKQIRKPYRKRLSKGANKELTNFFSIEAEKIRELGKTLKEFYLDEVKNCTSTAIEAVSHLKIYNSLFNSPSINSESAIIQKILLEEKQPERQQKQLQKQLQRQPQRQQKAIKADYEPEGLVILKKGPLFAIYKLFRSQHRRRRK